MTSRADVIAAARGWIGTPFVHAQRVKSAGVDCAGVVIGVARELGLVAPDFDVPPYVKEPDGSMLEWCRRYMNEIRRADMQPGDVVVLVADTEPQHLGILGDYRSGGLSIIHASNHPSANRTIETRLMFSRRMRFVAAFSLPGIA